MVALNEDVLEQLVEQREHVAVVVAAIAAALQFRGGFLRCRRGGFVKTEA
jgi:hypothetical protein